MRRIIAYVTELAIADGTHGVVAFIHAATIKKDVFAWKGFLLAEERTSFVIFGNRNVAKTELRCRNIHEADEVIHPLARIVWR